MEIEVKLNQKEDINTIMALLKTSYWAKDRLEEVMVKAIEHSECIYAYEKQNLVGFARLVTDYATVFWLCDVIVSENHRHEGIGKSMMHYIANLPYYKSLKGVLATNDAFGLYEQYGFVKEPVKMMTKPRL
ncbi:MAG: GNAT family N-acetyltransferase [Clostridia bacterium]|nr:GNAT family N-acetyltransferase [Clostridia bacterium]